MAVPTGFTLDEAPKLPSGFTLDAPESNTAPVLSSPGRGGRTRTPQELSTIKKLSESRPEEDTFGPGRMAMGADQLMGLSRGPDKKLRGIHNIATGLGESSLIAAPVAPLTAIGGMLAGGAGSAIGHAAAKGAGLSDEAADVAGDAGALGLGSVGAKFGSRAIRSLEPIVPNRVTEIPKWTVEKLSAIKQRFNELGKPNAAPVNQPPTTQDMVGKSPAPVKPFTQPPISGALPGTMDKPVRAPRPAPGWASSTPATAAPEADPPAPTPAALPSGRPVGSLQRVKELGLDLPEPPPKGPGPKLVSWQRMQAQGNAPAPEASPEKLPAPTSLPSGRKPGSIASQSVPATPAPANATAANPSRTAAELMKAVGISADSMANATPEQWKMIEQHAGGPVDRKATIAYLRANSTPSQATGDVAANRAARGLAPTEVAVTPDQARTPIRTRRR